RRGPDAQSGRHERAAFGARDDSGLAALPVSGRESIAPRAARTNGNARVEPTALSDSEKPGRFDRRKTAERRHHRDHLARWAEFVFHVARGSGGARRGWFAAFH